jgi:hypothetical protein
MLKEFTEVEKVERALRGPQFDRERHGGLFDRGRADSYYSREHDPHWYPEGTGNGKKISNLNSLELQEYNAGYDYNEQYGDKKSWD